MKELIALLKSQIAFEFEKIGELLKVVSVAGYNNEPVLSVTIVAENASEYIANWTSQYGEGTFSGEASDIIYDLVRCLEGLENKLEGAYSYDYKY